MIWGKLEKFACESILLSDIVMLFLFANASGIVFNGPPHRLNSFHGIDKNYWLLEIYRKWSILSILFTSTLSTILTITSPLDYYNSSQTGLFSELHANVTCSRSLLQTPTLHSLGQQPHRAQYFLFFLVIVCVPPECELHEGRDLVHVFFTTSLSVRHRIDPEIVWTSLNGHQSTCHTQYCSFSKIFELFSYMNFWMHLSRLHSTLPSCFTPGASPLKKPS